MTGIRVIWLLNFLLFAFPVIGQIRPQMGAARVAEPESEKEQKKISTRVKSWSLNGHGAFVDSVSVDTLYRDYHVFNPIYKNAITSTFTGNYGGPSLNNDFSSRNFSTGFYFARSHEPYLLTPSKLQYYNTTTPYTLIDYSQSENRNRKNETRLNVLHSQNVNPFLNFTFRYDQAKSDGQYNNQANKNHFISLYSSYMTEKVNIHGGFIFNRIRNQENGGMIDDNNLFGIETEYVAVRLLDAGSELRNSYWFATGEYKLGVMENLADTTVFRPVASAIYSVVLSNDSRLFKEGEREDNSGFFPNYYLNREFTLDSVRFGTITNLLQLKFYESAMRKYSFGKRVYAGAEVTRRQYAAPGYDAPVFPFHEGRYENHLYAGPYPRWNDRRYANLFIGGGIFRETGTFWRWNFEGRQFMTGYKAGQTEIEGTITKPVAFLGDSLSMIRITGDITNRVPDYFQQEYFSNRVKWSQNLSMEQAMNASFSYLSPGKHLDAGARYSLINNFIYHDLMGIPAQNRSELLVISAYLNKEFVAGGFRMRTHLLWQKASDEQVLHLPDLSARLTVSLSSVISKVLYTQIGLDTRYHTAYYADAYQPATGFFHLQDTKKLGNYPYMEAFANLKLKRTRVFFQFMNVGSRFLNKPYFNALYYPMNQMTFRLGVAWSFYD